MVKVIVIDFQMNIDPNDLIPNLPKPRDLQPFPTHQSLLFKGHKGMVRCIAVDPTGQWLVSGMDLTLINTFENNPKHVQCNCSSF